MTAGDEFAIDLFVVFVMVAAWLLWFFKVTR
jgi:hypothetical protein